MLLTYGKKIWQLLKIKLELHTIYGSHVSSYQRIFRFYLFNPSEEIYGNDGCCQYLHSISFTSLVENSLKEFIDNENLSEACKLIEYTDETVPEYMNCHDTPKANQRKCPTTIANDVVDNKERAPAFS